MKMFFVALAALLLFTGCDSLNKSTSDEKSEKWGNCDDNSTFGVMQNTIKKGFEDKAKTEGLSVSEARAFYSQLKITVDQVRTTKKDPSSTKQFCSGRINISIPVSILQKLEEKYKNTNSSELRKAIEQDGWEVNANVISTNSDFDVQPSDDGKWLFATLEQADVISNELYLLASWEQSEEIVKAVENKDNQTINNRTQDFSDEFMSTIAAKFLTGSEDKTYNIVATRNSNGNSIYCLRDMSICKTYDELIEYGLSTGMMGD